MIVYGRNAVREAQRGPRAVHRLWATARAGRVSWLRDAEIVAGDELGRLCGSPDHQGVCAEVDPYAYVEPDALLAAPAPLIVALDEVQDPQNLGAICRTAECTGATGVAIGRHRSAAVTAAVCRSSAGAVEHLAVARVRNLADFLGQAKAAGCWAYGAAAGGVAWDRPEYAGGVVLVLGAEGRGLRPRVAGACDELVALPLRGRVASLNVGAAAAALLYEMLRQREQALTEGS